MLEEIIEEIDKLPPVPNVINELQDMFYQDDYNSSDVEKVIKKDPNIVANILKIANSPLYEFTREIVDIRQAIVLFGLDKIIEFALASFVTDMLDLDLSLYHITPQQFLKSSQLKSKIASLFIQRKKERFIVSNTAFLSDISKIIISNYAKKQNLQLQFAIPISLNELDDVEKKQLGFNTIEVSAIMFDRWNFEENMIDLLLHFKEQANINQRAVFASRQVVSVDGSIIEEEKEKIEEIKNFTF